MRTILIGHRGVGKSSLLQRLQIYHHQLAKKIPIFDLDREIETSIGTSISDIFEVAGEEKFRKLENDLLQSLLTQKEFIIALGAGFELQNFSWPDDVEIVWVKRNSDKTGRIFLDRPRLDKSVAPLNEFLQRFQEREVLYKDYSDWTYLMPEGMNHPNATEASIFLNQIDDSAGICTLRDFDRAFDFYEFLEIRDDLFSEEVASGLIQNLQKEKLLLSYRRQDSYARFQAASAENYFTDWALELGEPQVRCDILSIHSRHIAENLQSVLERFPKSTEKHLKLAVEIRNFAELQIGLRWQADDPQRRSFLPRSQDGKWTWVRLWLKGQQKLNYINPGNSDQPDQPSLWQWLDAPEQIPGRLQFAAVLGSPVRHSFTPVEQGPFFRAMQAPVYAIDVDEAEWEIALPLLRKMGLKWAAVTSPLKMKAFELATEKSERVNTLRSVNTLYFDGAKSFAENTDYEGMKELLSCSEIQGPVAIWGGGGTLSLIQELLPKAISYSARTGVARGTATSEKGRIDTLIWAAPPRAELPTLDWQPRQVIDLNYREDSRAKEYCQLTGARYISGLLMFHVQAQMQRQFWGKAHGS